MWRELQQLSVLPGERLVLKGLNWQDFEQILAELGEKRAARIAYSNGSLEIMTPLFSHEHAKVLIGDLVKILLDELNLDYEAAGSTTFKNQAMDRGVEPDESFYINNCQRIRGKERIDLSVDPPPDLAIEIDITSRTQFDNYQLLGVAELWRYNGKRLQINVLRNGEYVQSKVSSIFPSFALVEKVPQILAESKQVGSAKVLREFRSWVREKIS